MTLPAEAELESVVTRDDVERALGAVDAPQPDVAIYDVVALLPRHQHERYRPRLLSRIDVLFCHKSGADGPDGFKGAYGMANFTSSEGWGRGWPGAPYQGWAPRVPDLDPEGRLVGYRTQRDDVRSYHTGGDANGRGVGIAMQGAYDGEWDLLASGRPRIEVVPAPDSLVVFRALVAYWMALHKIQLRRLSGHFEAKRFGGRKNKIVCPGDFLRQWVLATRKDGAAVERPELAPEPPEGAFGRRSPGVREVQAALRILDHDPGPLDGLWGFRSRAALERFQRASSLEPDGWFGPRTARALVEALTARGLSNPVAFQRHLEDLE